MTSDTMAAPPAELTFLLGTFGDHVDGAPLTYAALRLDPERIRRLLALIQGFDEGVRSGRFHSPVRRPLSPEEADLLPEFIPRKATQQKPYYKIFQEARRVFDGLLRTQILDPALIAHIPPVGRKGGELTIASGSISFRATQQPVERDMFTDSLQKEALYLALAMLTPAAELPALLEELAERAPDAFIRLLGDDAVPYFTTSGRREFSLSADVRLDAERTARMLGTGTPEVRESMMQRLSRILDQPAQEWLTTTLTPAVRRYGR